MRKSKRRLQASRLAEASGWLRACQAGHNPQAAPGSIKSSIGANREVELCVVQRPREWRRPVEDDRSNADQIVRLGETMGEQSDLPKQIAAL
ncbi:hypothetical protein BV22DRAFT_206222 [Leucogyrophana mollusca]|uniref:Uncharacterized protein n=1 Tax=Leucogyrophana mollusca TaxID=85980 RepID=A0ACB8BSG8_9AGAM|nr:hypothetical protein BV22DRAFT_206222 [Leucogyrophana mollusca]